MSNITTAELFNALPGFLAAPKDNAPVLQLCLRPDYGERTFPTEIQLTRQNGIPGERWSRAPWLKTPDGSPDPRIQVSILGKRIMDAVWRDRTVPHPGDTMIADMDFSHENMPVGQLLQAGTAIIRVSDVFNDACVKWKVRYGEDAKNFITIPEHVKYRLRGILCEVVEDGTVTLSDRLTKI